MFVFSIQSGRSVLVSCIWLLFLSLLILLLFRLCFVCLYSRIALLLFYFYRRYYFFVFACHSHRRLTLTIVNFSEYAKCLRLACRCRQFRQFLLGGFLAGICWFNNCRSPKTCFEPWLLLLFFVLNKKYKFLHFATSLLHFVVVSCSCCRVKLFVSIISLEIHFFYFISFRFVFL